MIRRFMVGPFRARICYRDTSSTNERRRTLQTAQFDPPVRGHAVTSKNTDLPIEPFGGTPRMSHYIEGEERRWDGYLLMPAMARSFH